MAMLWFGIRPMLSGGGAPQSSGVGANPSDSGQPSSPETFSPMSWSAALAIPDYQKCYQGLPPDVQESGVDGIDLVSCSSEGAVDFYLHAVDVSKLQVLWSTSAYHQVDGTTPDGVVVSAADGDSYVLDARTGNVLGHFHSEGVRTSGGMLVTIDGSDPANHVVCGRKITDVGTCVWTKSGPDLSLGWVFGGGAWVDLGSEIVDVTTGAPASFFPQPPPNTTFEYDGPAKDRVVRMTYNGAQGAIQLWNTQTGTGVGPVASLGGIASFPPLIADSELPNYMVFDSDWRTLRAYSWQTGEQQWQTTLAPEFDHPLGKIYGNTVLVYSPFIQSPIGVLAVDAGTGEVTGQAPQGSLRGVIASVAYLDDGSTIAAVDATTLAPLGSLAYPEPDALISVVGDHVVAMTQSGQYYVLQI